MDLQLRDRVVAVIGGASGIGLAIARSFAREGARVVLGDISAQVDHTAARLAGEFGFPAVGRRCDVRSEADLQSLAECAQQLGGCEHLVYAVGLGSGKFGFPFWERLTPSDWPAVLDINLTGAVRCAHAFVSQFVARKRGTWIFISSVAGQVGSQTDPPYSAAKAGLINFAQVAAKDLAPYQVRVNVISPGMVQTPLNRSVWQAWADAQPPEQRLSYEEWAGDKVRRLTPLGRWQSTDDIAAAALFLASPMSANITGQTLNVDGGWVMHS